MGRVAPVAGAVRSSRARHCLRCLLLYPAARAGHFGGGGLVDRQDHRSCHRNRASCPILPAESRRASAHLRFHLRGVGCGARIAPGARHWIADDPRILHRLGRADLRPRARAADSVCTGAGISLSARRRLARAARSVHLSRRARLVGFGVGYRKCDRGRHPHLHAPVPRGRPREDRRQCRGYCKEVAPGNTRADDQECRSDCAEQRRVRRAHCELQRQCARPRSDSPHHRDHRL